MEQKNVVMGTDFQFLDQESVYHGKVRDVYNINNESIIMVTTDRISAFDVVLPKGIPYKGQILNKIAEKFLKETKDIVPNWLYTSFGARSMFGLYCDPFPVEMIVRGYLVGSAWQKYKQGVREICGVKLPDGMKENEKFPTPIITPTTKAEQGQHDEDISKEEIIRQGLVSETNYKVLEEYSLTLFERGTEIAEKQGLILVDTKYEFGIYRNDGCIYLIDEVHTPDSSRYFYSEDYQKNFDAGLPQKQLSKEFVREWLKEQGFEGKEGQTVPEMSDEFCQQVFERYAELCEIITGEEFVPEDEDLSSLPQQLEEFLS